MAGVRARAGAPTDVTGAEGASPSALPETETSREVGDLDDVDDDQLGNRLTGARARAVLDFLARALVDDPEAVVIEADGDHQGPPGGRALNQGRPGRGSGGQGLVLRLHVAPDDMGRVIGRRGRMAQAIRALVRAAGAREGVEATVDIVD